MEVGQIVAFIQVGPKSYYSENMLFVHHCRQYMMSSSSNWAPNENKRCMEGFNKGKFLRNERKARTIEAALRH